MVGCRNKWRFKLLILLFFYSVKNHFFAVCTFHLFTPLTAQFWCVSWCARYFPCMLSCRCVSAMHRLGYYSLLATNGAWTHPSRWSHEMCSSNSLAQPCCASSIRSSLTYQIWSSSDDHLIGIWMYHCLFWLIQSVQQSNNSGQWYSTSTWSLSSPWLDIGWWLYVTHQWNSLGWDLLQWAHMLT